MELYTNILGYSRNYTPIYTLYTNLLGYFKNLYYFKTLWLFIYTYIYYGFVYSVLRILSREKWSIEFVIQPECIQLQSLRVSGWMWNKIDDFLVEAWYSLEQYIGLKEDKLSSTTVDFIRSEGNLETKRLG